MPKIDIETLEWHSGSGYPAPLDEITKRRHKRRLGDAVGLDQFGVNITRLEPGAGSALRHWHEKEDEFVYVLSGEVVLIEDEGEALLKSGEAAGFKAGIENGHQLVNRSTEDAIVLEVGTRAPTERGHYPDDDLLATKSADGFSFTHKNGTPYS